MHHFVSFMLVVSICLMYHVSLSNCNNSLLSMERV